MERASRINLSCWKGIVYEGGGIACRIEFDYKLLSSLSCIYSGLYSIDRK